MNLYESDNRIDKVVTYAKRLGLIANDFGEVAEAFGSLSATTLKVVNPESILPYIAAFGYEKQEHFIAILLNGIHEVIKTVVISKGLVNRSLVHPREVFAPAITERATAIIIVHNHPSGSVDSSSEDRDITKRLVEAGEILGISVLDHLIIGKAGKYLSFVEQGLMSYPSKE
jgi:DNA repair protein RadC